MFFGHIAVGLAAKPVAPKVPLGALLLSATATDTLAGIWLLILFVFLLMLPAVVPQLAQLLALATVLLLPPGNWVDRHRTANRAQMAAAAP